ncbi:helix-turn-helix domain-containing protein [Streptomyces sp. NPDC056486]|uniref:helix-turn-helix domain-containing protein n=1 Tax=Streptomyces sp. NPDC056486 TaxID=3345835 RepID=UPI0036D171DD
MSDLGEIARLTPFHMARLFRAETGLPPAQFLTAVRLEEAKRKLLNTDTSVADISNQVGYTSQGSFTTRFSRTFGVSPGQYRKMTSLGPDAVEVAGGQDDASFAYGTVKGRLYRSDGLDDAAAFVAAFRAGPAGSSVPARCYRMQRSADTWSISHVPAGMWKIEAVSLTSATGRNAVVAGSVGPVRVTPGAVLEADVTLQSARTADVEGDRCSFAFALPELYGS